MTTVNVSIIDPAGGGDYTSLQAWETDKQADIVTSDTIEVAECTGSGNLGAVTIAGWTTDNNHFIWIRAKNGEAHRGKFDVSNPPAAAQINANGSNDGIYINQVPNVRIQDLLIASGSRRQILAQASGLRVDNCLVNAGGAAAAAFSFGSSSLNIDFNGLLVVNTVISDFPSVAMQFQARGSSDPPLRAGVFNCTMWDDAGSSRTGIYSLGADAVVYSDNNYIRANTVYKLNFGGSIRKGVHDATFNAEAPNLDLRNISDDAFVFPLKGDFHLAGDKLVGSGTNTSTSGFIDLETKGGIFYKHGVVHDFEGHLRQGNKYDIGADQSQGRSRTNHMFGGI